MKRLKEKSPEAFASGPGSQDNSKKQDVLFACMCIIADFFNAINQLGELVL